MKAVSASLIALEIAVSKAKLNRHDNYIVCIRDITERHLAEVAMRGERRVFEKIAANAPLRRIGRPDDMAGAAIYLSSRAGAYLTGAIIPVDGGITTTR